MATIGTTKTKSGKCRYKILFFLDGERKTLSLGSKYTPKQVERIKAAVEEIAAAIETGGRVGKATAGFIADMTEDLKARFRACGLLGEAALTNKALWRRFERETASRRKDSTWAYFDTVEKRFFAFFADNDAPDRITKADCERWRDFLHKQGYKEATIAGSIQKVNTAFNWAVEVELIERNPFKGVKRGSFCNPERMFFIPRDWYEKLLEACPSQSWRTLLALMRIGGLRHTSETLRLTWDNVDWQNESLLVRSPKTERQGKGSRLIPLFPELKKELKAQWELAEEGGSPLIIPDLAADSTAKAQALSKQFRRIIFRAGLTPWERLFQNLRESRANELWTEYPDHVAAAWMGHTKRVAMGHYLQVTDEQFKRALRGDGNPAKTNETAKLREIAPVRS